MVKVELCFFFVLRFVATHVQHTLLLYIKFQFVRDFIQPTFQV